MKNPYQVIQISDIHLHRSHQKKLLGVNTQASFSAVLDLIKKNKHQPDSIILSGDLSHDGSLESYQRIANQLLPFKSPVYAIPGNHDRVEMMEKTYPTQPISSIKHFFLGIWQFILLDSHVPGHVEGFLNKDQFDFLKNTLRQYSSNPAIIVLHHHPLSVSSIWLDKLGLKNANSFLKLLSRYKNVHSILFGHVHQEISHQDHAIHYYSAPSTCIQFKKNSDNFVLDDIPPGYRLINLYPDGRLKTKVYRCEKYVGTFFKSAKGY